MKMVYKKTVVIKINSLEVGNQNRIITSLLIIVIEVLMMRNLLTIVVAITYLFLTSGCGIFDQFDNYDVEVKKVKGTIVEEHIESPEHDDRYVSVQEYTGEGYDLPGGEKNDKFAKEHFSEIAEAVKAFFLKKYKTEVIVHNVIGNSDGATVIVESIDEPHFHTYAIVPFDLKNKKVISDSIFTVEGEVENAITQGLVAMALDEEIINLNNYLEGLTKKYPIVGITEEAVNNVMPYGYVTPYYFINAFRSDFEDLYNAYINNPQITKKEIHSIFDKNGYEPIEIGFVIKFFMAEPDVEPNQEIFNQIKKDLETMKGLPRGEYSLTLNDNKIDKTNARGEKDNTLRTRDPNYIIRD